MHGTRERGAALYVALFALLIFVAMTVSMVMVSLANAREREASMQRAARRYLAEAGISDAIVALSSGASGEIASAGSPVSFGAGDYYVTVTDNGDSTFTIDSTGTVGSAARRMRCVARDISGGVFDHAMFAGNEDADPTYSLELGGSGGQADNVGGDIYAGGDINVTGDATATGTLRAGGVIHGATGEEGVNEPIPDIAAKNYEVNHDIDVAQQFRDGSPSYLADELGGDAWQLPEANPAHIFRLNPSDRSSEYVSTTKDDYFLEDPYEAVSSSSALSAEVVTRLTFSGVGGEPGPSSNDKVFFVDGNLWLHNRRLFSLSLMHRSGGIRVTFVVKGNVYISDNLLLENAVEDGIAFIAIEDAAVPDSGNIYFGDATFGTLERMDTFLYAENNFFDSNLSASGSTNIQVNGIMSAGNQVAIQRDYDATRHTRLELNYDRRIADGALVLPGLPTQSQGSNRRTMQIVSVHEVEAQ